jgi:hypothetical protein
MTYSRQDAIAAIGRSRRTIELARRDPDLADSRVGAMVALATLMEAFEVLDGAGQFGDLDALAALDEEVRTREQVRAERLARRPVPVDSSTLRDLRLARAETNDPGEIQRTREEINAYIARQETGEVADLLRASDEINDRRAAVAMAADEAEEYSGSVGELPVDAFNTYRMGDRPEEDVVAYRHQYDRSGLPATIQHSAFVLTADDGI